MRKLALSVAVALGTVACGNGSGVTIGSLGVDAGGGASLDGRAEVATSRDAGGQTLGSDAISAACIDASAGGCPCNAGETSACTEAGCLGTRQCVRVGTGELSSYSWGGCTAVTTNLTVPPGTTDLTTTSLTTGRACAEGASYSVVGLTSSGATLGTAPRVGCLTAGDEVMLINLQGSASATTNVGTYETLHVAEVSGTSVTFTTAKQRHYGAGQDDTNIGTGTGQQRVALVRVPNFCDVTIPKGATLTADPWNGLTGGVVALRGSSITIDGTVTAASLGYRSGSYSQSGDSCDANVTTQAGESIAGLGGDTTMNNGGGSGGIGVGSTMFSSDTPLSPSAGHATAGQPGENGQDRALGSPGAPYGVADGTQLTLGSGGGGNITCCCGTAGSGPSSPVLLPRSTSSGGIVALLGGDLTVTASGLVSASGSLDDRSAASGGYVLVRGGTVHLGTDQVTAKGAPGITPDLGLTNEASAGYVAVYYTGTLTGTTTPAAFSQKTSGP